LEKRQVFLFLPTTVKKNTRMQDQRTFLNTLHKDIGELVRQIESVRERDPGASQTITEHIKQNIEQAIVKIESMQVLAKQVALPDGTQQVLSLPVKIDGQWTDMEVSFFKRKQKGKHGTKGNGISVAIHVAPSRLGDIGVFMEYHDKRALSLRMDFAHKQTKAWFIENKNEMTKALVNIGFAQIQLTMSDRSADGTTLPKDQAQTVHTLIDIKG
jgi:hypothetical protein